MSKKLISIILPTYKEEKNVSLIYQELQKVFPHMSEKYDYEIIYINDGSPDNTWEEIVKICNKDTKVKAINLSRNFGKEVAISAGINEALGDAVITLDSDGQHPVEMLSSFLDEWEKGYDIVYNKRPNIEGASFIKNFSSKLFYYIFNLISDFKLEPGTTDYRLLDRKVVNYYIKFQEKNRLYRGLTDWLGFNKKALIFDAQRRLDDGVSSYSYKKLFNLAINSLTSFSMFPLKLVGYLGFLITFLSSGLLLLIIGDKLFLNFFQFSNIAVVIVLNTILIGVVLMSLGLIALYIGKIHEEVLHRPMFIIKDKVNF